VAKHKSIHPGFDAMVHHGHGGKHPGFKAGAKKEMEAPMPQADAQPAPLVQPTTAPPPGVMPPTTGGC
jgi:hypothetical protein